MRFFFAAISLLVTLSLSCDEGGGGGSDTGEKCKTSAGCGRDLECVGGECREICTTPGNPCRGGGTCFE